MQHTLLDETYYWMTTYGPVHDGSSGPTKEQKFEIVCALM